MSVEARPSLQRGGPAVHGSPDYGEMERLGLDPAAVLDFSVSANAYGPSPLVRAALAGVAIDRYPDSRAACLRRALAQHDGVDAGQVVVGNGAAELIWLLTAAYVRPGDAVAVLAPTFAEYGRAALACGAAVAPVVARAEDGFAWGAAAVAAALSRGPRLVFVCNPNNPTGVLLPPVVIDGWCRAAAGTLFVVDEAYLPFTAGAPSALSLGHENLVVLRSMTKDHALAGLRLGYAAGSPRVATALEAVRPPWNVNAMAQAAGLAALSDEQHVARALRCLAAAKDELVAGLTALGLEPLPSATHFVLVDVGCGAEFRRRLLRRRILVRDCASFGLPQHVRIATRRPEENRRLLAAVRRLALPARRAGTPI